MAGDLRTNRNEIIRVVRTFWANAPQLVGIAGQYPDLVVADIDNDSNPDDPPPSGVSTTKLPFARMRIQHTQSQGRAISGRRWQNNGNLTVNLFVNRQRTDAWMRAGLLADALTAALRKHRGNVYFIGVTPRERPINNGYNQHDVVSDFFWDEFTQPGA